MHAASALVLMDKRAGSCKAASGQHDAALGGQWRLQSDGKAIILAADGVSVCDGYMTVERMSSVDCDSFDATYGASARAAPTAFVTPGAGIHFVDIELPTVALSGVVGRYVQSSNLAGDPVLVPLDERPDDYGFEWHPVTRRRLEQADILSVTGLAAIEPFLDHWVPLPYYRAVVGEAGAEATFEAGPSNWARMFVARPAAAIGDVAVLKAVLAFDTRILDRPLDGEPRLAPDADDVARGSVFRLATRPGDLGELLAQAWLDAWVVEIHSEYCKEKASAAEFSLEHLARYLGFLQVLGQTSRMPAVHFLDADDDQGGSPIRHADLVLDIGDDRTAAMLVDRQTSQSAMSLAGCETVRIRDFGQPAVVYVGPCRTVGEFDRAGFGNPNISRQSGRADAFLWPSLMRIGEEGARLSLKPSAMPGTTGLANLRAALSACAQNPAVWRFSRAESQGAEPGAMVAGEALAHLTEEGNVIGAGDTTAEPALRPRFSQSAMLSMFVAELLLHTLSQLGSGPQSVAEPAVRRLAHVIVTCPADADRTERELLLQRVQGGIDLVWQSYGWDAAGTAVTPARPRAMLGLDATLTAQMLFLLDELELKLGSSTRQLAALCRGIDPEAAEASTLTIASLDVARHATSLAIVDYNTSAHGAIDPSLVLADRSRIAGGDLSELIAMNAILPAIADQLTRIGHGDGDHLSALLAGRAEGADSTDGDRQLVGRYWQRILLPAADAVLDLHRQMLPGAGTDGPRQYPLATLVRWGGGRLTPLDLQVNIQAKQSGARGFRLADVVVNFRPRELSRLIEQRLAPLMTRICEVAAQQRCDLLLLTGPLSDLPALRKLLLAGSTLAPHRIVNLADRELDLISQAKVEAGLVGNATRLLPLIGAALVNGTSVEVEGLGLLGEHLAEVSPAIAGAGLAAIGTHAPAIEARLGYEPPVPISTIGDDGLVESTGPHRLVEVGARRVAAGAGS